MLLLPTQLTTQLGSSCLVLLLASRLFPEHLHSLRNSSLQVLLLSQGCVQSSADSLHQSQQQQLLQLQVGHLLLQGLFALRGVAHVSWHEYGATHSHKLIGWSFRRLLHF